MATTVTKVVDPNSGSGYDYASLSLWEAGQQGDLTGVRDEIAVAKCRCTGGTADTTAVTVAGWTTSTTQYIKIWTDPSESYRHAGTFPTGNKYRMDRSGEADEWDATLIGVTVPDVKIIGVAFAPRSAGVAFGGGTVFRGEVSHCVFKGKGLNENYKMGIGVGSASLSSATSIKISNCTIYDFGGTTGAYSGGIVAMEDTGSSYLSLFIYNCTAVNCKVGFFRDVSSRSDIKNCIASGCVDGFFTEWVWDYNGSTCSNNASSIASDAPGTNSRDSQTFTFAGASDFHLTSNDTGALGFGLNLYNDANYPFQTDIDGQDRGGAAAAWDIGADEYVAAAAASDQKSFRFFSTGDELPHINAPTAPLIEAGDITESYNNTATDSWNVSRPAQAVGDLIVMHIGSDANVTHGTLPAGPNGETAVTLTNSLGDAATASVRISVWYWIATGANAAGTVTVTPSATEQWYAAAARVLAGEFNAASPISAGATSVGTSGASTCPAFTPATSYGRPVFFCGVDADPVNAAPADWTLLTSTSDRGAANIGLVVRNAASTASSQVTSAAVGGVDDGHAEISYLVNAPAGVADGRTPLAAAGTDPTLEVDTAYGVQARVENSGAADTDTFQWQYKLNAGSWTDVSGASSVVVATLTADFVNDADVLEYLFGTGTFVVQNNAAMESSGTITLGAALGANNSFESHLNFVIVGTDVADEDTIQLRLIRGDDSELETYTDLPLITVNKGAAGSVIPLLMYQYRARRQ